MSGDKSNVLSGDKNMMYFLSNKYKIFDILKCFNLPYKLEPNRNPNSQLNADKKKR